MAALWGVPRQYHAVRVLLVCVVPVYLLQTGLKALMIHSRPRPPSTNYVNAAFFVCDMYKLVVVARRR